MIGRAFGGAARAARLKRAAPGGALFNKGMTSGGWRKGMKPHAAAAAGRKAGKPGLLSRARATATKHPYYSIAAGAGVFGAIGYGMGRQNNTGGPYYY